MTRAIPDAVAQQIAAAICNSDNPCNSLETLLCRAAGCASLLHLTAENSSLAPDDFAATLETIAADLNAAQALFAYLRDFIDFDAGAQA